ncbi:transposase [Psychrobacter sp. NG27]|nr:transposase [Psychrobacter sp. NG27]
MDSVQFHKNKHTQKLLNRHGNRMLWLPSYSFTLNPIEKKLAQAKFIRQGWMNSNLHKLFHDISCVYFILD